MSIHSVIQGVPAIIWSGLLASFVTLVGVMLSNGSNTKRLLRQLAHDAEQKRQDRMAALHKEVYLKTAEELVRASSYLGKISQLDPSKENLSEGFAELFAVSAKAQLIAQSEASKLLGELTARYGELLMRLVQHVMPVHGISAEIRIASDFIDRNRLEAQRVLDEMKQANKSGTMTKPRYEALDQAFKHASEMADSFSEKRDELFLKHSAAHRDFNVALFREIRDIGPIQVRALAALRSELGLETDVADYMRRMEENWVRMDRELEAVMNKLIGG